MLLLIYYVAWLPLALTYQDTIVLLDRMYFSWLDKKHVDAYAGVIFVNRTQKAIFGNLTLFTPLSKDDSCVTFEIHRLTRNQYKPTVIKFKENIHHALASFDFFGIQDLKRNFVTPLPEWPIKLNVTYRLRPWVIDYDRMPPLLPPGEYQSITEIFLNENRKIATLFGFYNVIETLA